METKAGNINMSWHPAGMTVGVGDQVSLIQTDLIYPVTKWQLPFIERCNNVHRHTWRCGH